ncbi:RICIN domain-containing protein [Kitasatospora sp. NBC_01266]|uniref:RICIN domain-containing protein n=1 Tax=Kitasatospora sp. NBC_01266 TaxID=2903572 RepID=UPI002E36D5AC|nr:RICIN domain-containing protein [Kitasatospora sp. NBC_01266]
MRRSVAALLTALLALLGVAVLPSAAQADSPGQCATGYGGPSASATCGSVSPGTIWQVQAVCFYVVDNEPITYWVAGNNVTGNGTSTAFCNGGDRATSTIREVTVGEAGSQGRLVGYAGKCVDIDHGSTNRGTPVQIFTCNGTSSQWWTLGVDYTVRALGMCLNVVNGGTADGNNVEIYTCIGSPSEQWVPQPDGSLKNTGSGKCLDDLGFSTTDRTQLGIWDCNGAANQKWVLTP